MATAVAKKTFSIKQDLASHLDLYKNKSRFVNEALDYERLVYETIRKNRYIKAFCK